MPQGKKKDLVAKIRPLRNKKCKTLELGEYQILAYRSARHPKLVNSETDDHFLTMLVCPNTNTF